MRLESSLERRLDRRITRMGGMTLKMTPVPAGVPDRLVMLPGGRFILVELKADGGRLRPIQQAWHEKAERIGFEVLVLRGERELEAWLDAVCDDLIK